MSYSSLDTFYVTDDQLHNSPTRKDGIDEATEMTLRIYGCNLIQESGILLKLPQQVVATGQVLFHRFYCKRSFVHFNVKRIVAACIWLASRVGENQRRAREVIDVFQRMECREEKPSTDNFDPSSKKMYSELKMDLTRCELHILRELSFICHVELPHKLMLSYIAVLGTPPRLLQEAWNLANDSLRSTLCVRLKPEVIACGVVYAAARRVHIPLPENPPWWEVFDADKKGIDEVCRVLARLYSLPKAQYVPVCQEDGSFTSVSTIQPNTLRKEAPSPMVVVANETKVYSPTPNDATLIVKAACHKLLATDSSCKSDDDPRRSIPANTEFRVTALLESKQHKTTSDLPSETEKEKDGHTSRDHRRGRDCHQREREQEKERHTSRDRRRGRDYYEGERQQKERHTSRDRRRRRYYYGKERNTMTPSGTEKKLSNMGTIDCIEVVNMMKEDMHAEQKRRHSSQVGVNIAGNMTKR